jgi:fido (protein-threonine AMPylation protein)
MAPASAGTTRETLDYDFSQEKSFAYQGLTLQHTAAHLAKFVSDLWQIHAFGEGNTRTTGVFAIKYLHTLGFDVINNIFAVNSRYYRNTLVHTNYNDLKKDVHATQEYLDRFLETCFWARKMS